MIPNKSENTFKVMVVDDDKDLRDMLVTLINSSGKLDAEAIPVASGEEALDKMEEEHFDIVLTDQRMDGISGIELLTRIKDEYPETIRILITAYSDVKTARDAVNDAKVHYYLEKPCSNEEIITTLNRELERLEERKSLDIVKVGRMMDVRDVLENFKRSFSSVSKEHAGIVSLPRYGKKGRFNMLLEFDGPTEFNKFSFELKDNEELQQNHQPRVEDVQIFENRYLVTVSLKP